MNKLCPLCNNTLIIKDGVFECNLLFGHNKEYYEDKDFFVITDANFAIDYYYPKNNTYFECLKDRTYFIINGKFKIINNSVSQTYDHYKKMRLFS